MRIPLSGKYASVQDFLKKKRSLLSTTFKPLLRAVLGLDSPPKQRPTLLTADATLRTTPRASLSATVDAEIQTPSALMTLVAHPLNNNAMLPNALASLKESAPML
jgi:hypothetical protein